MNKEYKIKLDLNKRLYNRKMAFNQFDENVNDFYIEITKNKEVIKDLDKSIVTLVAIKPSGEVEAQFGCSIVRSVFAQEYNEYLQ